MSGDDHAPSIWDVNATGEPFLPELMAGGTIDELARAASEHGVMITLSFIPATDEDEESS